MEYAASVIVKFGESTTAGAAPAVVDLDGELNINPSGEVVTTFKAGDEPRLLIHFDYDSYYIEKVETSSGMMVSMGDAVRERTGSFDFVDSDATVSLPYIPAGGISWAWFGNVPIMSNDKNIVRIDGGFAPATGDAKYNVNFKSYKLFPPALDFNADRKYRIFVVFTLGEK